MFDDQEDVATVAGLRALYPPASERSLRKEIDHVDGHCARFIGLSPLCVLATVGGDGGADLGPRGGDPGWVRVLDAHTLLLPDRPGNYRLDNLTNVVERDRVALLFLVPGIDETLRVYGRAGVVVLDGAEPKERTGLRVDVERAFFHCAKALIRSHLWDASRHVDRRSFPTMGQIVNDHTGMDAPVETQKEMLARYAPTL